MQNSASTWTKKWEIMRTNSFTKRIKPCAVQLNDKLFIRDVAIWAITGISFIEREQKLTY